MLPLPHQTATTRGVGDSGCLEQFGDEWPGSAEERGGDRELASGLRDKWAVLYMSLRGERHPCLRSQWRSEGKKECHFCSHMFE